MPQTTLAGISSSRGLTERTRCGDAVEASRVHLEKGSEIAFPFERAMAALAMVLLLLSLIG